MRSPKLMLSVALALVCAAGCHWMPGETKKDAETEALEKRVAELEAKLNETPTPADAEEGEEAAAPAEPAAPEARPARPSASPSYAAAPTRRPEPEPVLVAAWAEPDHLQPGGGQAHILIRVQRRGGAPAAGVEVRLRTSRGVLYPAGKVLRTDEHGRTRDLLTTRRTAVVTLNAGGTRYSFVVPVLPREAAASPARVRWSSAVVAQGHAIAEVGR